MNRWALIVLALMPILLGACMESAKPVRPSESGTPEISFSAVGKSDVDMFTDRTIQANMRDLRRLMEKLYKRNPREWKKTGIPPEQRMEQVFDGPHIPLIKGLEDVRDLAALRLAFDPEFTGDRVLAFVYGLKTMILTAYGDKTDFYLFDDVDPQSLSNSARNVEIAAWKLMTVYDDRGQPLIYSNAIEGEVVNLSYERLLSKIIARQDMMARIVADKSQRAFRTVIQSFASAVFLPIN